MTRYSRSVIPGRQHGEDRGEKSAIDNSIFGTTRKKSPVVANDASEPDFLPPVEDDEADLLVGRSNVDRRKNDDRRKAGSDRRASDERRASARKHSDYVPLREQGGYRSLDDSKRGPILLVGALMIVAVFGVVVWNAYREDGGTGETTEVAELAESGPFKRPFIDTNETPAPTIAEEAEVLDALDGAPSASSEVRPAAAPSPAAVAPTLAPAKRQPEPVAKPPAPLTQPSTSTAPVRAATAVTPQGPVALTPAPATAPVAKPPAATPAPVAAPRPAVATPPVAASLPSFSAGGPWLAQIASTSSETGALEEWGRRAKSWPDLLSSAERSIQTADVNGETRYRLRVGAFASKADATAFCAQVKTRGGNCLPAQR